MKINSNLIRALREDRSWSQSALARAAGINLRTVQRIENEAAASPASLQALATAFGIDARDLETGGADDVGRYEFRLVEIDPADGLSGHPRTEDLAGLLNAEGREGWSLVQILPPDLSGRLGAGRTGRFVAVMQRLLPPQSTMA